jgi:hypothetical protein
MSVLVGPRANIRVTCDASPSNDRSESALAANPLNPYNLVGSSKRFTNPQTYAFSLAAYATFDGGQSWTEASPLGLLSGWDGVSDPAVAWDDVGNAYLVDCLSKVRSRWQLPSTSQPMAGGRGALRI